jgi:hypothetical protein
VLLAIIIVREVQDVTIDDPSHENGCEENPGENIKVDSVFVMSSQDPNNVQAKGALRKPDDEEDLDPEDYGDTTPFTIMSADLTNKNYDEQD